MKITPAGHLRGTHRPIAKGLLGRCRPALALAASLVAAWATAQEEPVPESVDIVQIPEGEVYIIGDAIVVDVTFSGALGTAVDQPMLTVQLAPTTEPSAEERPAKCRVQEEEARKLRCIYIVVEGDEGDGVSVAAGALKGGQLTPEQMQNPASKGHYTREIDGVRLKLYEVTVNSPPKGAWTAGETVEVTFRFADREDQPKLHDDFRVHLVLENGNRQMKGVSDTDGELKFHYTVEAGDTAGNFGLNVTGERSLKDKNGNEGFVTADINAEIVPETGRKIDTQGPRPLVRSLEVVTDAQTYNIDGDIDFVLGFSEDLGPVGGVWIEVTVGTGTYLAECREYQDAHEILCTLTVDDGWLDTDGVSTPANPLRFAEGALVDQFGNVAINEYAAQSFAQHKVDGVRPTITALWVESAPTVYGIDGEIRFVLEFSEELREPKGVALTVAVGVRTHSTAPCIRGDDTATIRCTLTVLESWLDTDGVSTTANPLTGVDGLKDTVGNAAINRFAARSFPDHEVDGVGPTVTDATLTVPTAHVSNSVVVRLTFSEPVLVTGLPRVGLSIEGGNSQAFATYAKTTSSEVVEFRYALVAEDVEGFVQNGNNDRTVTIDVGRVELSRITDAVDNGSDWDVSQHRLPQKSLRLLENGADVAVPRLERTSLRKGGLFGKDDTIEVDVLFSEPVTVSEGVKLKLRIGTEDFEIERRADAQPQALHTFTRDVACCQTGRVSVSEILLPKGASILDRDEPGKGWTAAATQPLRIGTSLSGATAEVDTEAPTVKSAAFLRVPGPNAHKNLRAYYGKDAKVWIEVTMSEAVEVTDIPEFSLNVGDDKPKASYLRHASTDTRLVFQYAVKDGHQDDRGIGFSGSELASISESVHDLAGNVAEVDHLGDVSADHLVDATLPGGNQVLAREPGQPDQPGTSAPHPAGQPAARCTGECSAGDVLTIDIPMEPPVLYTTAPQLVLLFDAGASPRLSASPPSGENVSRLTFTYTIRDGDEDLDGIQARLEGTFTVADGRTVPGTTTLNLPSSVRVDAKPPAIASVEITSTPDRGDTYVAGDEIEVTVQFTEPVEIGPGASASLAIDVGGVSRTMRWQPPDPGTNADAFVFRYEVVEGDNDPNGISVAAITNLTLRDAGGREATVSHDGIRDAAGHRVDTVGPTVTELAVTGPGARLEEGDAITVRVSFDEPVVVGDSEASPGQLTLMIGEDTRPADYVSGDGTRQLVFRYTVAAGDSGTVSVGVDAFTGDIGDAGGNAVTVPMVYSFANYTVDALPPHTGTPRITTDPGTEGYIPGDTIRVLVPFDEPVRVTPTADGPRVALYIGGVRRFAGYEGGTGTDELTFTYVVMADDKDDDGIAVGNNVAPWLELVGSTIRDLSGLDVVSSRVAVYFTQHTVRPAVAISRVTIVSNPGRDQTYITGDTIEVAIQFERPVNVRQPPTLAIDIGSGQGTASYARGSGTDTLVFAYTVRTGDLDRDGISIAADALQRGGGTVVDATELRASRQHPGIGDRADHKVDAVPAVVTAATVVSDPGDDGIYILGDTIRAAVTFSKPVTVTGTPTLRVAVGTESRAAAVVGGSGSSRLLLAYTVQQGDLDEDGISVNANSFDLDGGRIEDANGLAARLDHPPIPDLPEHRVDGTAPAITDTRFTSSPADGEAYDTGETIQVRVTFGERVRVRGSPALALQIGVESRLAACETASSTTLSCAYTVARDDFDADGVSIEADSLVRGKITDEPGNDASRAHAAVPDQDGHKVYAARPEAVGTLPPMNLLSGETATADLDGLFRGFNPTYTASSSAPDIAAAEVSGLTLTVTAGGQGSATVTVTATNAAGSADLAFEVTVATDPVEKAVLEDALAAIGRSMLSSTAHVIGSRFNLASHAASMALGGQRFAPRAFAGDPAAAWRRDPFHRSGWIDRHPHDSPLTSAQLLGGTAFNIPLPAGVSGLALWGAGDLAAFSGEPQSGMYEGTAAAGFLGVDAHGDGWLAGVSVARHGAEADYDFAGTVEGEGTLATGVTSLHPYARMDLGEDAEAWVIAGFGGGDVDLTREHIGGVTESSDVSMAMVMGGLERALQMELEALRGAALSLRGDAGFLSLDTDGGSDRAVDDLAASVSRLRLGVEATWNLRGTTPFLEMAGRLDGGDGQTGGGIELAGGLRHAFPESGLAVEAKARVLALHTGDGYSESGFGATATFDPGAPGRGVTFRLAPRWGGSADATDLFWDERRDLGDAARYGLGPRGQTWGMDAALGYGFQLRSMPGLVTPFSQWDVTGDRERRIRVGLRYGLATDPRRGTRFEISAEQVESGRFRGAERRASIRAESRF